MLRKRTEEFLSKYDTEYTTTDFIIIRAYSTIVGFATGVILASTSMLAGQPLFIGVTMGTLLTIFGNQIPKMAVQRKDKKIKKKKLMAMLEEEEMKMMMEKDYKNFIEENEKEKNLKEFFENESTKKEKKERKK